MINDPDLFCLGSTGAIPAFMRIHRHRIAHSTYAVT